MTECTKTAMSPYIRLLPTWVARRMNLPNTSIFLSIPISEHGLAIIRFNEAVRMMKENPEFSNDAISTECGFSSHTQIYRIFKQKTGLSPSQWREQMI